MPRQKPLLLGGNIVLGLFVTIFFAAQWALCSSKVFPEQATYQTWSLDTLAHDPFLSIYDVPAGRASGRFNELMSQCAHDEHLLTMSELETFEFGKKSKLHAQLVNDRVKAGEKVTLLKTIPVDYTLSKHMC